MVAWPAQRTPFDVAKPLLLVDVDGVLNCMNSLWTPDYEDEHFVELPNAEGYPIRMRHGTPQRIARLAEHFEMVWATAWCENAHPYWSAPLGLAEPWPHLDFKNIQMRDGMTWKLPTVIAFAERHPGRALAWIDDDLRNDAFTWASQRLVGGAQTMLVRTDPCFGLGAEAEARLLTFVGVTA